MRRLVVWLAIALVPAAIGAAFSAPDYYARLDRPSWAPPGWLFGPVETVIYAMMGVAAWLVAKRGGSGSRPALGLFGAQLILNAAWTPIFLGLRKPAWR